MAWIVPLVPLLAVPALVASARGAPPAIRRRRLAWVAGAIMTVTTVLAVIAAIRGWTGALRWTGELGLHLDFAHATAPIAGVLAVLVPAVAGVVMVYAAYHEESSGLTRLLGVLTFFVGGMELVAGAADLLTLLVGWELIGACSAVLVSHEWRDPGNGRAGVAVFLTTRAGDLGLFLALAAAFAGAGSLSYDALGGLPASHLQLVAAGLLAAAAAKSAQLPFAPWLFAAMRGPVTVSTLLHSATMVAAGAFLLIRLHPVLEPVAWFGSATLAVGLVTALAGGTVALLQPHAKRLLAGSTSAHCGLMFVAIGAGYPAVAAVHLVAHAVAKAPLFLATGIARKCAGSYKLHTMGLRSALPLVALPTAVAAAAIAGLPPLGAAWSKEKVVAAAGHHAPWLAVLVTVAGALSAAYMGRFFFQAFGPGGGPCDRRPDPAERWPLVLLAAAALFLGVLWLPGGHDAAGRLLPGEIAAGKAWEVALSLGLVVLGIACGRAIARARPLLGEVGLAAALADWLAIPALVRMTVVRPGRALCRALAAFDDRLVDGILRAIAGGARRLAATAALFDDTIVDGAVRLVAALGAGIAEAGRRLFEVLMDGVPEGTARLAARSGAAARRLQTGLSHHYYRVIVAGLAIIIVILVLGG